MDQKIPLALQITPGDTARATITPFSAHHLPEITEYLFGKGFKTVGLFPAYNLNWGEEDLDAWEKGIRKAYDIAVTQDGVISSVLRGAPRINLRFSYCGAGKGLWAFDSQGVLYNCHHLTNQPEYVVINAAEASIDMIKDALFSKTLAPQQTQEVPVKCQSCPVVSYCGGGCWAENLAIGGESYLPESVACTFRQRTFESLKDALTEPPDDNNDELRACWVAKVCCMISCDNTCESCDSNCIRCDIHCDYSCDRCDTYCVGCQTHCEGQMGND